MPYDTTRPTGAQQHVSPERQEAAAERLEREAATAARMERHYWTVMVLHHASDGLLDGFDNDEPDQRLLDVDTMLGPPALVCYNCELDYHPSLRRRRCRPAPMERRR